MCHPCYWIPDPGSRSAEVIPLTLKLAKGFDVRTCTPTTLQITEARMAQLGSAGETEAYEVKGPGPRSQASDHQGQDQDQDQSQISRETNCLVCLGSRGFLGYRTFGFKTGAVLGKLFTLDLCQFHRICSGLCVPKAWGTVRVVRHIHLCPQCSRRQSWKQL